ncbi:MAG: DNA polymerase III, subunit gamma and tau [Candidatus Nealsonbacteria bacterium RIFOXYB1_FULL_40_15]|uniref:DNA polymerase III subunit gamma/tau n=2 Tax=Candidatus Nealsoniibacteriota TaxID=1817911 RepID=A0A1G2ERH2_9BACT|nr:MAG: DNA polymerase III, subunit gamma and tau [Candidatus Nealsonbacteria bacterium RIFOXYB1_FULL_40_15]OGZ28396.1 MAG: DNA polymerase III, subunit gamma and tau [Candidatus Nealsonbacteria bacterium RIFOXYC1_FULL_40_7]OGZ29522.1 MAG: DNA polymerase III, subunit gamma and tau [Candidatus Nealsonbacteria bacterium RIFOXYD1_FULL_39_11]
MDNLALYRKYRPQSFSEIIGQEHIIQTLKNALSSNNASHAYIFSGPRGSGKTTTARLLAKALNCRNRKEGESEPCNKCSSCLEVKDGRSLDLIEIDAASHRGIDEVRELKEGIRFSPNKEKYKVFVIDECHMLTKEAVNALLKTLEEPPSHAVFILATTEIHKMAPTIISRCQRFDFRRLEFQEILKRLEHISKKEGAKIEKPALELIALHSEGAVRDAESLLDQVLTFSGKADITKDSIKEMLGLADTAWASEFSWFLSKRDIKGAFEFLEQSLEKGYDPMELSKTLVSYLRHVLILSINPEVVSGFSKEEKETMKNQAEILGYGGLQKALGLFMDAENRMKYSSIPQLPLELAIVDFLKENQ